VGESIVAYRDGAHNDTVNADPIFAQAANWNCRKNECRPGKPCATFLQAVDRRATRIGCGFKHCLDNTPFKDEAERPWNFLVCWYNPQYKGELRPFPASRCKERRLTALKAPHKVRGAAVLPKRKN